MYFSVQLVIGMMVVSTCSILSAMLSLYLSSKSSAVRVPKSVRFIAFNVLAKLFFLRKEVPEEAEFPDVQKNELMEMVNVGERPKTAGKMPRLSNDQLEGLRMDLMILKDIVVNREKENFVVDEWKCLGKIIDRLLFWLCFISFVISLIVTLS